MENVKALKIMCEQSDPLSLVEAVNDSGQKTLYIEGIFSTHSQKNKNGRMYSKEILSREIDKISEKVKNRTLYGELNHPQSVEINLERAAILVESLVWDGPHVHGKAFVLETPMGAIIRGCTKYGLVGVSSRGLGTVGADSWVNDDYNMITYDVVSEPSNSPSWVKGICESKTYYVNESGVIVREEDNITLVDKEDAFKQMLEEMKSEIKLMVEATIEEKLKTQEKKENIDGLGEMDESTAKKVYTNILKEHIKHMFDK